MPSPYPNREVRENAVRDALCADWDASNAEIGRRTSTSHPYVASVRVKMLEAEPHWKPTLTAFEMVVHERDELRRINAQLLADSMVLVEELRALRSRFAEVAA